MRFKEAVKILHTHRKDLTRFGVRALSLFGSISRDEGRAGSDVDILIDFDSKMGLFVFVDLKNYLESLLECDVDLVTKNSLHPALKKRILQEARHVF